MLSALLFDFGGTLDGEGLHWLDRFYSIYARQRPDIAPSRIKAAFYEADARLEADPAIASCGFGETMRRHAAWQLRHLGVDDDALAERLACEFTGAAERALARNRRVLERLHDRGYRLGVVSNFYGNVATLCEEAGFGPYLDAVLDSAVVGLRKPDTALFTAALEQLGVAAAEAAMVGDSFDRDVRPARRVGMHAYWVSPPGRACPDPSLVDGVVESLGELPDRLAEAVPS